MNNDELLKVTWNVKQMLYPYNSSYNYPALHTYIYNTRITIDEFNQGKGERGPINPDFATYSTIDIGMIMTMM